MKKIFYLLFITATKADLLPFDSAEDRHQWKLYEAKNNWCFLTPAPLPEDEDELIPTYIEIMEEQKVGTMLDLPATRTPIASFLTPAGDDSIMAPEETLSWSKG